MSETRLIEFEEGKEKEKISHKKVSFAWLEQFLTSLNDAFKSEGISSTYLYFSPQPKEEVDKRVIDLLCEPSYLSCFLRDIGIFTKKFFLAAVQEESRKFEYGNIAKKFAEKIQSLGIDVRYSKFEGGAFISNGNISLVSMKNNLKAHPEFLKECGELYEFPGLDLHIDSFINFLNKETFSVNSSCLESVSNDIEYMSCDLSCIEKIVNLLKRKGYNQIEIYGYHGGSEYVVGNLLNLGNNKIVIVDPTNCASRAIEGEGIDVINLYEEESFRYLSRLRAGPKSLTLPIKRCY